MKGAACLAFKGCAQILLLGAATVSAFTPSLCTLCLPPSSRSIVTRITRSTVRWMTDNAPGTTTSDSSDISSSSPESKGTKKRIVVVGGGWAGFSAADALASAEIDPATGESPVEVILLDASPRGRGGLAGSWKTPGGRQVEAGVHGFWKEYRNTFAAMERIGLNLSDVLGPYSPSVLISKSGRVALAPVLGKEEEEEEEGVEKKDGHKFPSPLDLILSPGAALELIADLLPPPLDVALVSEFNPSSPLTLVDRASAVGLLGAWADFGQEDPKSWDIYDKVSAEELFLRKAGVTEALYEELVQPLLHVLPMCPGYDCSAAAALSCFHVFALQSKGAFDVRWCRGGITEKIFDPWAKQLVEGGDVAIRGSSRVTSVTQVDTADTGTDGPHFEVTLNDGEDTIVCDGVIFAVGGTSMGKLVAASPETDALMGPQGFDRVRGVTCVAARLFLEPDAISSGLSGGKHDSTLLPPDVAKALKDTPVAVCGPEIGGIPELQETGFCVYDLQRMQDKFAVDDEKETAVLEVDFFRADSIADIRDDQEVAALALKAVGRALGTQVIDLSKVVDMSVVRARDAVSHFAVNSAQCSPQVKIRRGVYMCGDWIDRKGHASWSTEKSVVTGRQAVAALAKDLGLKCRTDIIEAAPDTAQLKALRTIARKLRETIPPPGSGIPSSPWSLAKELVEGTDS
mmetsp:Transcript_15289/g.34162  ORF Transcript_15289/g.34162 Transcript_15289/m.34162 type:complete len:686 (+) Transcript_15289:77-2134(+)